MDDLIIFGSDETTKIISIYFYRRGVVRVVFTHTLPLPSEDRDVVFNRTSAQKRGEKERRRRIRTRKKKKREEKEEEKK